MLVIPSLPIVPNGCALEEPEKDEEQGEDCVKSDGATDYFAEGGRGEESHVEEEEGKLHGADLCEVEELHGEEDLGFRLVRSKREGKEERTWMKSVIWRKPTLQISNPKPLCVTR